MGERLAQKLSLAKLDQLKDRLSLTEQHGEDGGPFQVLVSARDGSPTGETRILLGDGVVKKVVYHAIEAAFIGLDSHMIFAFTDADSAVPHWTLDSVLNDPTYAFHLDLLPRVDLGSHRAYMDYVYEPLNDAFTAGSTYGGLSAPNLSPRQRSIMSQWMLAYRVDAEAYPGIEVHVQRYLDRWYDLVANGIPEDVLATLKDTDLPSRDLANRRIIFNREVDPVWNLITPLVGDRQSEFLRAQLETNAVIHYADIPEDYTIPR